MRKTYSSRPHQPRQEVAMSKETPKKVGPPQIVICNKALKLAEKWVNRMTRVIEDGDSGVEQGRPTRLGLGAKVPRQSQNVPSDDPVARKLQAKLDAVRRKAAKSTEESVASRRDTSNENSDDDEDLESRTSAFTKKRAMSVSSSSQAKKKKK